jgi:hypothetical protein
MRTLGDHLALPHVEVFSNNNDLFGFHFTRFPFLFD